MTTHPKTDECKLAINNIDKCYNDNQLYQSQIKLYENSFNMQTILFISLIVISVWLMFNIRSKK